MVDTLTSLATLIPDLIKWTEHPHIWLEISTPNVELKAFASESANYNKIFFLYVPL